VAKDADGLQIVAENKKARHNFRILETFEAGLVLTGTEVKSLRSGSISLNEGYVRFINNEPFAVEMNIPPYACGNRQNHDPFRKRKLLLNRAEIRKLLIRVRERGMTMVPLKLYFKRGYAKLLIALVSGKKQYDKREDMKKRDTARELDRARRRGRH
jgi:SsrA-binding protein